MFRYNFFRKFLSEKYNHTTCYFLECEQRRKCAEILADIKRNTEERGGKFVEGKRYYALAVNYFIIEERERGKINEGKEQTLSKFFYRLG